MVPSPISSGFAPFTSMNSQQALESLTPSAPQLPVRWNRSVLRDMNSVTPLSIQSRFPHGWPMLQVTQGPVPSQVPPLINRRDERNAFLSPSVTSLISPQLSSAVWIRTVSRMVISSVFVFSSGSSSTWPSGGVTRVALRMHAVSGGSAGGQPRPSPT